MIPSIRIMLFFDKIICYNENVLVCMKGDLFMASKKQEIRKQIKKKEAKELEELGLNPDVEVVDLNDD